METAGRHERQEALSPTLPTSSPLAGDNDVHGGRDRYVHCGENCVVGHEHAIGWRRRRTQN
eukprot:scaffold64205_cov28-Tisochrysis_lutea.AAC.1